MKCGQCQVTDWIDVSVTVRHGMPHWPDNPPNVLERMLDTGRGDACNVSHLAMGVHSGTHMESLRSQSVTVIVVARQSAVQRPRRSR